MTVIALTLICLALVALLALREHLSHGERQEWAQERRLLVTRIQSPELAPLLAPRHEDDGPPSGPPTEQEEIWALVHGETVDGDES